MSRPPNYLFCRYAMRIGDDTLTGAAQRTLLADNQGNEFDHGRQREGIVPSALCTDPEPFRVSGRDCISFYVGYKPGVRSKQRYNKQTKRWEHDVEPDDHTKLAHLVAVPDIGALAILDRQSDEYIPALQAIGALRSLLRFVADDQESALDIVHATDDDIRRALDTWDLTEYSYTARPLNPLPGTPFSRRRSEAYKAEGIGQESGKVRPAQGQEMRGNGGPIQETRDLWEDGYAQIGVKGDLPGGHHANIKKAKFHQERVKNLKEREKPQFLRVIMEEDEAEPHSPTTIAKALMAFYG